MKMLMDAVFGIVSGAASSMGLGGGAILILYLTMFAGKEQTNAQAISLFFFIPVALIAVIMHHRNKFIKWNILLKTVPFSLAGAFFGFYFLKNANSTILSKLFGVFLFIMGIYFIFQKNKKEERN
jgi:uncharacterized membrane protein YfcA